MKNANESFRVEIIDDYIRDGVFWMSYAVYLGNERVEMSETACIDEVFKRLESRYEVQFMATTSLSNRF